MKISWKCCGRHEDVSLRQGERFACCNKIFIEIPFDDDTNRKLLLVRSTYPCKTVHVPSSINRLLLSYSILMSVFEMAIPLSSNYDRTRIKHLNIQACKLQPCYSFQLLKRFSSLFLCLIIIIITLIIHCWVIMLYFLSFLEMFKKKMSGKIGFYCSFFTF